jgi:acetylornithine deacetylase/succinyl-diaminopimelate desuccinylase-like protein
VNNAASPTADDLLDNLRLLCAAPSVSGQLRALADGADAVASVLRGAGLDCRIVATGGAPIVVGRYDTGAAKTLLLYGRYDVPPPGLRRNWINDPFQPTVRDDVVYARGAVIKGELVARAAALRTLIWQGLQLNVVVVIEGESLIGSPSLQAARELVGDCHAALWSGGGFDARGVPLLYSGVKGLLRAELKARTATATVPGAYAATVQNPIWTLAFALTSIKSEFEEILIEGFYDEITPPSRAALNSVQQLDVGDGQRRAAWGIDHFIANVGGAMLARTETFSPSINLVNFNVSGGGASAIPERASVELDIQLVPDLQPDRLFELLRDHLQARGFHAVEADRLPGSYSPYRSAEPVLDVDEAVQSTYGQAGALVPLAPFAAPAAVLLTDASFLSCGLERPDSALFGPDERLPIADLVAHTTLITEMLRRAAV